MRVEANTPNTHMTKSSIRILPKLDNFIRQCELTELAIYHLIR